MSIKRYIASNAREAMAQLRRELGEDAVILSNKRVGRQVEILAAAGNAMDAFVEDARSARTGESRAASSNASSTSAPSSEIESFREFIARQQTPKAEPRPVVRAGTPADNSMLKPNAVAMYADIAAARESDPTPAPTQASRPASLGEAAAEAAVFRRRPSRPPEARPEAATGSLFSSAPERSPPPMALVGSPREKALLEEVQAMRDLLEGQLSSLVMNESQRRHPLQARVMTRLMTSGFSPRLAREIASRLPESMNATEADKWLGDLIAMNVKTIGDVDSLIERRGVYALVGPTGVGKTTTVAKLAARFAVKYGTASLGLITLDSYRIGAHDQLRAYGRILGAAVHLAQDADTLRELLESLQGKRLVLIDTCGVSQRDERLAEMLDVLRGNEVEQVLLLNAASQAETLEDVACAWRASECAGAILTKLDEAARIGGALDCLMRYKLGLFGVTNGQRVPEDWHAAAPAVLAQAALRPASALFALDEPEAALLAQAAITASRSSAHV